MEHNEVKYDKTRSACIAKKHPRGYTAEFLGGRIMANFNILHCTCLYV